MITLENEYSQAMFYALSTDEKPVETYNGMPLLNTSIWYEMDRQRFYIYDAENKVWLDM